MPVGALTVTPAIDYQSWRFDPATLRGVPFPQTFRDRDVVQGEIAARYLMGPFGGAIAVLRALDTHYISAQPGQPSRDSRGAMLLAGLDHADDGLWHWRVLLGAALRQFSAPQYRDHAAPVAEADVIWNPNGMMTLTGELSRTIEDAAQEGIAGYTYTRARVAIDREARPDVLVQVRAGLQIAEYLQDGGTQTVASAGAGITWLVNRHLRVSLNYDHTSQQGAPRAQLGAGLSSVTLPSAGSYARDVALLGVRVAL